MLYTALVPVAPWDQWFRGGGGGQGQYFSGKPKIFSDKPKNFPEDNILNLSPPPPPRRQPWQFPTTLTIFRRVSTIGGPPGHGATASFSVFISNTTNYQAIIVMYKRILKLIQKILTAYFVLWNFNIWRMYTRYIMSWFPLRKSAKEFLWKIVWYFCYINIFFVAIARGKIKRFIISALLNCQTLDKPVILIFVTNNIEPRLHTEVVHTT